MNKIDVLQVVSHITQVEAGMTETEAANIRETLGEDLFQLVSVALTRKQLDECMDGGLH